MGRQFTYYCLPDDLAQIETEVLAPAGGRLFESVRTPEGESLVPAERFSLDRTLMGKQSLFLLLAPPDPLSRTVFRGPWVDTFNSHLIEVGRCFTDGSILRSARFWYEARTFVNKEFGGKPPEFVSWAQSIFRKTKKLLHRQTVYLSEHPYKEWFGASAWHAVSAGQLRALAVGSNHSLNRTVSGGLPSAPAGTAG